MRIFFDVSALFRDRRVESGVPTYTLSLIKIFQKLPHEVVFFYSGYKTFGLETYIPEYVHLSIPNKIVQLLTFFGVKFDWLIERFGRWRGDGNSKSSFRAKRSEVEKSHGDWTRPYDEISPLSSRLGRDDNRGGAVFDIYFTSNVSTFYRYFSKKIKVVGAVHDLSHILFPELKPFGERWKYAGQSKTHIIERLAFWNRSRKPIFERFNHLVAISEHTKKDLVEFLKILEQRITVLYPLLQLNRHPESNSGTRNENKEQTDLSSQTLIWDPNSKQQKQKELNSFDFDFGFLDSSSKAGMTIRELERFGIRKSYLLFLGHIEPRKNVENLMRAFSLLKQARTHPPTQRLRRTGAEQKADSHGRLEKLQLVVAGRQGYQFNKLLDLAYSLGLTYRNCFLEANRISQISNFKFSILRSRSSTSTPGLRSRFGGVGEDGQISPPKADQPQAENLNEQNSYSSYYGDRINNSTSKISNENGFQASNSTHYSLLTTHYFDVIFTGPVSEEEKYMLMRNAEVFVYPSLYEGFAYPCLEAMSVGTPVVTSPVSALPEVLGDAALYANPWRPEMIARVVEEVLHDQNLRDDLVQKGKKQIEKFQNSEIQPHQWKELFKKI